MAKRRKGAIKFFALRKGNSEASVFSGRQPRQAALKAAARGFTDIKLRERGTKRVHVFKGDRVKVDAPANRPSWMGAKIWKPRVKKLGVEHLKK